MTNNESRKALMSNVVAPAGLLLVLFASVVPFFLRSQAWAMVAYPYIYAAGALAIFAARIFSQQKGGDLRLRRLRRMEVWIGIIFLVATFFLFYPGAELRTRPVQAPAAATAPAGQFDTPAAAPVVETEAVKVEETAAPAAEAEGENR